jgi:hypothetical protein
MRRDREEKVHYKMYKDGKKWVYAGIFVVALSGAGLSASVLAPMAPVQAATTEKNGHYSWDNNPSVLQKAIDGGYFVDATPGDKLSTVTLESDDQIQKFMDAHLKLTLDGNEWYISPATDYTKVDLDTALAGMGFPSDQVLSDPTTPENEKTILAFIAKSGLFTMNGGDAGDNGGNLKNNLISASTYSFISEDKNQASSSVGHTITGTDYSNIITGSLETNTGITDKDTLLTNGGVIKSENGHLAWDVSNSLTRYHFSDGILSSKLTALKQAALKISESYNSDASNIPAKDQYNINEIPLDFSTAKQVNGKYVFTVNTDDYSTADFIIKLATRDEALLK